MDILERIQGSIFGGAVGDALGYAVEFLSYDEILKIYGPNGIENFRLFDKRAIFSDDTQMSLFTANAILVWDTMQKLMDENISPNVYINKGYKEWHKGQIGLDLDGRNEMWIYNYPQLIEPRHPGRTIMTSLNTGIQNSPNNSKGCGAVMRVAPIGLFFYQEEDSYICKLAKENSLLTHGHPMSYMSSSYLVILIKDVLNNPHKDLKEIIFNTLKKINVFYKGEKDLTQFNNIVKLGIQLSEKDGNDLHMIEEIGQGWIAEEALSIAIYSSLKYKKNFYKALVCSVNHSGDSDSTGSITGNILGSYLGVKQVAKGFSIPDLENYDLIFELSKDLYNKSPDNLRENYDIKWIMKYITADYGKNLS